MSKYVNERVAKAAAAVVAAAESSENGGTLNVSRILTLFLIPSKSLSYAIRAIIDVGLWCDGSSCDCWHTQMAKHVGIANSFIFYPQVYRN